MKIYHLRLISPIDGVRVSSPLVGEDKGEGYFPVYTIKEKIFVSCEGKRIDF
jgi:hypothetical protein